MLHYLRRAIPAYLSFSNWSHQFCEWMITGQLKCLEGHKSLHWRSKKNPCPQVLKQPLSSKSFYKVVLPFLLLLLLASVPQVSGRMVHWWSFTSLTTAKQQRPSSHSRSHAHSSSECFFPPLMVLPAPRCFHRSHSRPEAALPQSTNQAGKQAWRDTQVHGGGTSDGGDRPTNGCCLSALLWEMDLFGPIKVRLCADTSIHVVMRS